MKFFDVPSFKINGETIQEVDNVKYLFLIHYVMTKTFYGNADNYARGNTLLRKFYTFSTEMKLLEKQVVCQKC